MYYKMLESRLQFVAAVAVDEKTAYAIPCNFNGLFKIDLETEICEFIQFFPDLEVCKPWRFFTAVQGDKGIYFSPSSAHYIAMYDIGENKIHKIPLPEVEKLFQDNNYRLGDAFYWRENMYFVGATCGCILKLEESTGKISVIDSDIQDAVFFRRGMLVDDIYYIPSANSSIILEYRLQTDETIVHSIEGAGGAWSLWGDGERFWLPPRAKGDSIRCWIKSTDSTSAVEIQAYDYQPKNMNFLKVFNCGNSLILSPEYANMFLRVDMRTKKAERFDIACVNDVERYGYYFETGKSFYFVTYINGKKHIDFKIDRNTLAVSRVHFTLKNLDIGATGAELKKVFLTMKENETDTLEDFITLIRLLP